MDKTLTQLIGSKPGLKIEKATSSDAFNNLNTTVQQDWQELTSDENKNRAGLVEYFQCAYT